MGGWSTWELKDVQGVWKAEDFFGVFGKIRMDHSVFKGQIMWQIDYFDLQIVFTCWIRGNQVRVEIEENWLGVGVIWVSKIVKVLNDVNYKASRKNWVWFLPQKKVVKSHNLVLAKIRKLTSRQKFDHCKVEKNLLQFNNMADISPISLPFLLSWENAEKSCKNPTWKYSRNCLNYLLWCQITECSHESRWDDPAWKVWMITT